MTDYIISREWISELISLHVSDARKREIRDMVLSRPAPSSLSTDDAIPFSDWLSIHDAAIRNATIIALQEKMCDLVDSGMKTPLATFDAAVYELNKSLRTKEQP